MLGEAPAHRHSELLVVPPLAMRYNLGTICQGAFALYRLLLNVDISFLNETKSNFLIKARIVLSDLTQGERLYCTGCSRDWVHSHHGSIVNTLLHKKYCYIFS